MIPHALRLPRDIDLNWLCDLDSAEWYM